MAESSSTSSSNPERDPPGGMPKAFLLSLAIIAFVELGVRLAGPQRMSAYTVGATEFDTVSTSLQDQGPAEIVFLGTSRGREAIVLPQLEKALKKNLGRSYSLANYSCGGARASELEVIAAAMLRRGKPKLVLYGLSPRALLGTQQIPSRMSPFWGIDDWKHHRDRDPKRYNPQLPSVIRNEIGALYRTLRYRPRLGALAEDLFQVLAHPHGARTWRDVLTLDPIPTPIRGDLSLWQRYQSHVSLQSRPISEQRVENYIHTVLEDGRYEITSSKIESLRRTIQLCQQNHVPIVLFQVPLSNILQRHLPKGTMESFHQNVSDLAAQTAIPFLRARDLTPNAPTSQTFTDAHFLEQSHLNLAGASLVTSALTRQVIIPHLSAPQLPRGTD